MKQRQTPPTQPPSLTNTVRTLRLSRLIPSQLELSRQSGIPAYLIYSWESGRRLPMPEHAAVLADFFGVCMDEIYGRIPAGKAHHEQSNGTPAHMQMHI